MKRLLAVLAAMAVLPILSFAQSSTQALSAVRNAPRDGDPVDLATGLYWREYVDLKVKDTIPIVVDRYYLSEDRRSRAFGIGGSTNLDMAIIGDSTNFSWVALVRGNGSQEKYRRTSPGTGFSDAVFRAAEVSKAFENSTIRWTGMLWWARWEVDLASGEKLFIRPCDAGTPNIRACGLVEIRDAKGHSLKIDRASNGTIRRVTSPSDFYLAFTNDSALRITRVADKTGRYVQYEYDSKGRLSRVVSPTDKFEYRYSYNDRDEMTMVEESEGPMQLRNTFLDGRCIAQTVQTTSPDGKSKTLNYSWRYYTTGDGEVWKTDALGPDGTTKSWLFDSNGDVTTELVFPNTPQEARIDYTRDSRATARISSLTLTCKVRGRRVKASAAVRGDPYELSSSMRQACDKPRLGGKVKATAQHRRR